MKTSSFPKQPSGYVSLLTVLILCFGLLLLMVFAYKQACNTQEASQSIQLRVDYREKEEAVLRSLVAITPNRAMRTMMDQSNASAANREPLKWTSIFNDAINLANARESIDADVLDNLPDKDIIVSNKTDSAMSNVSLLFSALNNETTPVSSGLNRSLGTNYPAPLSCTNTTVSDLDAQYPIIGYSKTIGAVTQSNVDYPVATYSKFNTYRYPNVNFGYCKPGDPFVARRNWWAFSLELAGQDADLTHVARAKRDFVMSIYEIPSQLGISASSFMALGDHANGSSWQNITIQGGVFTGRATVADGSAFNSLATRRGAALPYSANIGGQHFNTDPMAPGLREDYMLTQGDFFPVSLASESGKAAFIPISQGSNFLDRFAFATNSNTLSPTTWNTYTVGAMQCKMRIDITEAAPDRTPTKLRFSWQKGGVLQNWDIPLPLPSVTTALAGRFQEIASEGGSYDFGTQMVDVCYGVNNQFYIQYNVTGKINFNSGVFGDPYPGATKKGYWRPAMPFGIKSLPDGKLCVAVYPQRFKAFLGSMPSGPDSLAINNSIAVNVNYTDVASNLTKPSIPCTDLDYGVILEESENLTDFTTGFSLVTNLRLYHGDNFNLVKNTTTPAGYTGDFYPPCSIFAAEKRYGTTVDPHFVNLYGQVSSLVDENAANPSRPLDIKLTAGNALSADRIHANLRPITHPADLPPVYMMNWLVLVEEVKKEYSE